MIPKIIHYCWFGNQNKPENVITTIKSWKRILFDYEIIEWNETNCNINNSPNFVVEAYKRGKWAFVSDYFRLKALYEYGGIYLDTDVEVLKTFNNLLINDFFIGFEDSEHLCTATIGCSKGNSIILNFMKKYDNYNYVEIPNSKLFYDYLIGNKTCDIHQQLEIAASSIICPVDYFSPKSFYKKNFTIPKICYSIHHYNGTWKSKKQKFKDIILKTSYKLLGEKNTKKLKKIFNKKVD